MVIVNRLSKKNNQKIQKNKNKNKIHCENQINSNNISLHAMGFGSKMDKPSSSQEGGVVGLNFHQSKEVLINDTNGSIYTVC